MAGYEPTVWVDNSAPRLNAAALNKIEQGIADLSNVTLDPDLTAIGALTGTGLLKRTGDETWVLDTNTYALGTHTHAISDVTSLQTTLNLKAPLASPALTGTPTAPTAAAATNTTQIATTAFVRTEVSNLVDSAPSTLDTLNELAAALGDDPNFATTVTNALASKAPLSHTHAISDVTGLQTALDGKQPSGSYLTANQTITLSGDATGSGTTAITVTVVDDSHSHTSSTISALDAGDTTTGTFNIARIPTGTTDTTVALGNHTHSYVSLVSSTDNAIVRFNGAAGSVQDSSVLIDDDAQITAGRLKIGDGTYATDGVIHAVDDSNPIVYLGASGSYIPRIRGVRPGGTWASPSTTATSTNLLEIDGIGYKASAFGSFAGIRIMTGSGTINDTSTPGRVSLYATPDGSTTWTERLRVTHTISAFASTYIEPTGQDATLVVQAESGRTAYLNLKTLGSNDLYQVWQRGGTTRFAFRCTEDDFSVRSADNTGDIWATAPNGNVFQINRATGKVTLGNHTTGTYTAGLEFGSSGPRMMVGTGSPEGNVTAPAGSEWRQTDDSSLTYLRWYKASGSGNTGWLPDFEGRWVSYTSTVTASTTNPTGVTQDCEYTQTGKVAHVRISVTIPQATKGSGNYEFSLPVTADSTLGPCGSAHRDGVPEYGGFAWLTSTTKCGMAMNGVRITDAAVNTTTVTFRMLLTYQAA